MIAYALKVILCSGLFLVLYHFMLERRMPILWNRICLSAGMVAAALIPLLRLPILPARSQPALFPLGGVPVAATDAISSPALNYWHLLSAVLYACIAAGMCLWLLQDARKMVRLRRHPLRLTRGDGFILVEHPDIASPFSFWRTIFLGTSLEPQERDIVLRHELSHVRHLHTLDKLLLSLLRALLWFNPFYWLAVQSLAQLQEWEADGDVLRSGIDSRSYQAIVFKQLFGCFPNLSSALVQGPVKRRFSRMMQMPGKKYPGLSVGVAVGLLALQVLAFGATNRPLTVQLPSYTSPSQDGTALLVVYGAGNTESVSVISGIVRDEDGEPLQNVVVHVEGTSVFVSTDRRGGFALACTQPSSLRLTFSMLGKQTVTLPAGPQTRRVILPDAPTELASSIVAAVPGL